MSWKFFIKRIIKKLQLRFFPAFISIDKQIDKIKTPDYEYFVWLTQHKLNSSYEVLIQSILWNPFRAPFFSILVPVYNTPEEWLETCILSVVNQSIPNWELLLSDDASTNLETKQALKKFSRYSSRIKVLHSNGNKGISAATNLAASQASGKYLVFLDHDDLLSPDALKKIYDTIQKNQSVDVLYSDEDRLSVAGYRYRHHFKPGFSPSLLEMCNYMLHLMCVKAKYFQSVGQLRPEFDGSQDYDLLLRLLDAKAKFIHIPDILYTWRESDASMAGGADKPEIFINGKKALLEHINRRSEEGVIVDSPLTERGDYWIQFALPEKVNLLIITNQEEKYFKSIPKRYKYIIESYDLNNVSPAVLALKVESPVDVVLFLADDIVPDNWELFLDECVSWALRPDVGIVGGSLLTDNDLIVHAGVTLLPSLQIQYDFGGKFIQDCSMARRLRDCFSVSGLAMGIKWTNLISFMESDELSSTTWDIELCLKATNKGLRVVYNPHAVAHTNAGSVPHTLLPPKDDLNNLLKHYEVIKDSYLNPNLISSYNDFRLAEQLPKYEAVIHFPLPKEKTRKRLLNKNNSTIKFSFLLPTYNSDLVFLDEMVESIINQTYSNFEVNISDDASTVPNVKKYLKDLQKRDSRFNIYFSSERGGIAVNTNRCMKMVTGDYVVLCDHDDRLELYALQFFVDYVSKHPNADIIYSDEDIINVDGMRHSPHYRPDWNPDMLMSQMYFPHLITIKSELARKVGHMNPELTGSQDYDYMLRVTEQAQHVGHIPEILYSWRSHPVSVAQNASAKMYAFKAALQALRDALSRRNEKAEVFYASGSALGVYRVKREFCSTTISHIIAAKTDAVIETIKNIQQASKMDVEVVVILPNSEDGLCERLKKQSGVVVDTAPDNASRAEYYNHGVKISKSNMLIFSPENIHIIDSDYPNALIEHTSRKEIGVVGCKIIYPNGFFYHTGIILGVNGVCGYAHRNTWQGPGYWYYANCIRNYTAVSWDLMAVSRENWESVGGFDEEIPKYSDIDFCLKLVTKGYKHIYTPYVIGVLNRSVHRLGELRCSEAEKILLGRYKDLIENDPNYHPLLSRKKEDFSLAEQ